MNPFARSIIPLAIAAALAASLADAQLVGSGQRPGTNPPTLAPQQPQPSRPVLIFPQPLVRPGAPVVGGFGYYPYYYDSGTGTIIGYPGVYGGYGGFSYVPPTFVVAPETMYGPGAMRRFMGVDQPQVRQRDNYDPRDDAPRPKVRQTSADTKILAGKSLDAGDSQFAKLKYASALEHYKTAIQTAPDLGESYFHQAHVLVAMGQYAAAGKAFRKGLEIGPDWIDSGFRIEQLYGDNRLAKSSQFEALALAVEQKPKDANLLFVLGMQLFFDGQEERAQAFFKRSVALGGNRDHLLDPLLAFGKPVAKKLGKNGRVEF